MKIYSTPGSIRCLFFTGIIWLMMTEVRSQSVSIKYSATVGGELSGHMVRGAFLAQDGIGGLWHITEEHWERFPIDSFSVMILRDSLVIFTGKIKGNRFSDELRTSFKMIQKNDRVFFYSIYGRNVEGVRIFVRPIEYIID